MEGCYWSYGIHALRWVSTENDSEIFMHLFHRRLRCIYSHQAYGFRLNKVIFALFSFQKMNHQQFPKTHRASCGWFCGWFSTGGGQRVWGALWEGAYSNMLRSSAFRIWLMEHHERFWSDLRGFRRILKWVHGQIASWKPSVKAKYNKWKCNKNSLVLNLKTINI